MQKLFAMLLSILTCAVLSSGAARAETTNSVDIAALTASGVGAADGWTLVGTDSYSDGVPNIRLNAKDEYVQSPAFARPVKRILLSVRSSSTGGRRLAVIPVSEDGSAILGESSWRICGHTESGSSYEKRELVFSAAEDVRRFRLALETDGTTTAWGVSELAVVLHEPCEAQTPADISFSDVRSRSFTVNWPPDPRAVSNTLTLYEVRSATDGGEVVVRHSFDEFSNAGDTREKTAEIVAAYPDLDGSSALSLPKNSSGLLKISLQGRRGVLAHRAFDDYSDLWISMTLSKMSDADLDTTSVAYECPAGVTNKLHTVGISTEMRTVTLPLAGVPGGCGILVNADGRKENHQVVIDEMSFIRSYSAAAVTTNLVRSVATRSGGRMRMTGLAPETDYLVQITATDASAVESPPSALFPVRTRRGADGGLVITLR